MSKKKLIKNKQNEILIVINNFLFYPLGYSEYHTNVSNLTKSDINYFFPNYNKDLINNHLVELKEKKKKEYKKLLAYCSIEYSILVGCNYHINDNLFHFVAFLKDLSDKSKSL